jgi:hypothetical protein
VCTGRRQLATLNAAIDGRDVEAELVGDLLGLQVFALVSGGRHLSATVRLRIWSGKTRVRVATFPKGYYARNVHRHNRRITGASTSTSPGKFTWTVTPVDAIGLRGLPAISRGWAGGAIRGTRPGDGLFR